MLLHIYYRDSFPANFTFLAFLFSLNSENYFLVTEIWIQVLQGYRNCKGPHTFIFNSGFFGGCFDTKNLYLRNKKIKLNFTMTIELPLYSAAVYLAVCLVWVWWLFWSRSGEADCSWAHQKKKKKKTPGETPRCTTFIYCMSGTLKVLINCDSRMALGEAAFSDEANCLYKCVFGEGREEPRTRVCGWRRNEPVAA